MSDINFSTYAKILQKGLQDPNSNEAVVSLLLGSILSQDYMKKLNEEIDVNPKMTSNLLTQKTEIHQEIKNASVLPEVITKANTYFEENIITSLNPHTIDDMYSKLLSTINNDSDISGAKRNSLLDLYKNKKQGEFLSSLFLYSIHRTNKIINVPVEDSDFYLLSEASNNCPLCHKDLVKSIKGTSYKQYEIMNIFPDDLSDTKKTKFINAKKPCKNLNSFENQIALCKECADNYSVSPTVDEYISICAAKEKTVQSYKIQNAMNGIELEEQIVDVLHSIASLKASPNVKELSLSALKIEQKISPDNFLLRNSTKSYVLSYYNYIESLFSQMERDGLIEFKLIASEVSLCYEKLESNGLSQEEIYSYLTDWFMNKANLNNKYSSACNIIVAFFVQNCEVFHEISQ